jgi:hypothetical protein
MTSTLADHAKLLPAIDHAPPKRAPRIGRERCPVQYMDDVLAIISPDLKRGDGWLQSVAAFLDASVIGAGGKQLSDDEVIEKLRAWSANGATYDEEKFEADCAWYLERRGEARERAGLGTVDSLARQHGYKGKPPSWSPPTAPRLVRRDGKAVDDYHWNDIPGPGDGEEDGYADLVAHFKAKLLASGSRQRMASYFGDIAKSAPVPWIIPGWLSQNSVWLLYGQSEHFKTYVLLTMLLCIATGTPWAAYDGFEGYAVGEPRRAAILAGESYNGVIQRVNALIEGLGFDRQLVESNLIIVRDVYALNNAEGLAGAADEFKALGATQLAAIGYDTLTLALDGDEDSAGDIKLALRGLRALATMFGAVGIAVDHVGHSEQARPRGSSAKKANADGMILCERDGDSRSVTLTQHKNRDDDKSQYRAAFTGKLVEMGNDPKTGRAISDLAFCAVKPPLRATVKDKAKAISDMYEAQFLTALQRVAESDGTAIWPNVSAAMIGMNGISGAREIEKFRGEIKNWWQRWERRAEFDTGRRGANNSVILSVNPLPRNSAPKETDL